MPMQAVADQWTDRFLPMRNDVSVEELKKYRLLVFVCFLTGFLALSYCIISLIIDFPAGVVAMALSSVLMAGLPYAIRSGASRRVIANIYIGAIFIDTIVITSLSGGLTQSITASYIPIVPVLGVMLVNQRTGFIWFFAVVSELLALGVAEISGVEFPTTYDPAFDATFELAAFLGVVVILFFIVRNFDNIAQRALRQVEAEQEKSESLLLNILPAEVAEELKATGRAEAQEFDKVTILFSDFKNFTGISANMTPSDLVAELNVCFYAFDAIMDTYHLEKIKTIGDAYMAASGLPHEKRSGPVDMIFAALEMQEFLARHREVRMSEGKPSFVMRVGIHTGPVVAGIVGVKKFQYDIWGDTVNTASRMETSGGIGQVNLSEATYALVKNEPGLIFTPRGRVEAKGKGELEMYFVMSSTPDNATPPPNVSPGIFPEPNFVPPTGG